MAISDSQADDPRDQALARLAGLDMHKALDVLGTGKINRTVLMRSLKIFDGVVFTEDVVTALLSALGATPRGGNFDIEDIAKLVRMATPSPSGFGPLRPLPPLLLTGIGGANAQRGRSRAVLDKDEARLREMFELCKSIDAEGSVGVKKRDLVQVCRNSMHVARMLCLRKSMVQQAVEEVSRDVMETVFQGLEPLDDDAIVTFQALKELYINTALTTSSLSRLEPEQDAVAHNDNADELPAEEVEEMIVAGRLQDAANAIICAQYLSTTGKSISQSRSAHEHGGRSKGRGQKTWNPREIHFLVVFLMRRMRSLTSRRCLEGSLSSRKQALLSRRGWSWTRLTCARSLSSASQEVVWFQEPSFSRPSSCRLR
eukprot:TRINITY_DN9317_c0_g1_i2.p1 TRINITY_DN9317_c0_g1~~TRINITY_DN9317_c0_g1_i2.p1  ORF type:complete len:392 (+),score=58.85 TRINITY_DN9317_c0_g1_i2:66-1178(+)